MLVPTIAMAVIAVTLFVVAYSRGSGEHLAGLRIGWTMTLQILPLLVLAFTVAGLVQVLVSQELISRWVGESAGLRGIMLGSLAGGLAPGGPYVSLPIAAGLMTSGAGIGTMVAFLTGWSLWAFARLPMEVGILGWKLTAARIVSTLIFPPLAGIIAQSLFGQGK
jgi:uncharacterized membrane protein YraQ (UPF0718 family)